MIAFNRENASRKALQDALVAKNKALRLMHAAVQDIDVIGGDVALAAALFFVNVELIESGKHGWRAHLEGAGRIMSLLEPSASSGKLFEKLYAIRLLHVSSLPPSMQFAADII